MKKKSGYIVDKVTEDSFFENLLLGLPKLLDSFVTISQKRLRRNPPASTADINHWQKLNGVTLSEDLKNFYLSSNGLLYTYVFSYGVTRNPDKNEEEEEEEENLIGKIHVNQLHEVLLTQGYEIKSKAHVINWGYSYRVDLSHDSRVFILSNIDNVHFVVLIYLTVYTNPNIWLFDSRHFYFLANDFATYLRMAIAHLGVPYWQLAFSAKGLPGSSRAMLQILAPGVLLDDQSLVATPIPNGPLNVVRSFVFLNKINRCKEERKDITVVPPKEDNSKRKRRKSKSPPIRGMT